ncbi:Hypothetical predicted protein [Lecanosticta acicola]|uniref:Serine hydrolase domain-containing protein n=1 Tax=Lecanosticta acicola TaxID=111012 RepID=A0AAI9ECK3_9PEZI|nr:Hypothetical predicted protein [Lecanosticta acicola]
MSASRLRVLCLHGFTSNGQVHAHQLRRITKALPEYDFLFPDGPHVVDISSQMDMTSTANQQWSEMVHALSTSGHRAWWYAREGNWHNKERGGFHGLEESLDSIGNYIRDNGPIHSIWGFSQGACFAGMLCALLQDKLAGHPLRKHLPSPLDAPKAGIIFSGFRARFSQYDGLYEPGIDMPMLHVVGEKDQLVSSERSEALVRVCSKSEFLKHSAGHEIPKSDEDQARIIDFFKRNVPTDGRSHIQPSM